ncbi:hypothetical protein GCM10025780_18140 [Frondihabitans cladoniiphilus]|uniref:Uncharacterized protein n=1 Tax=Frondihabitans cladoniiphilus TaxID=715785 RepID=A0ABP8VY02_9MICO
MHPPTGSPFPPSRRVRPARGRESALRVGRSGPPTGPQRLGTSYLPAAVSVEVVVVPVDAPLVAVGVVVVVEALPERA